MNKKTTQTELIKKTMLDLSILGYSKQKIYDVISNEYGIPRPTVRRAINNFIIELRAMIERFDQSDFYKCPNCGNERIRKFTRTCRKCYFKLNWDDD